MIYSRQQIEQEMRSLVESGKSLREALQIMSRKGYGMRLLIDPVEAIAQVDSHEAIRIVVRELGQDQKPEKEGEKERK
jgi:hypothetical protein